MFSWPEVVVIGTVALVFFGPKRLPEMAKSLGQGIKEFKKATQEGMQALSTDAPMPQETACPACQKAIPDAKAQFCPYCGKSLATVPASAS